jgi:hypothetical protein
MSVVLVFLIIALVFLMVTNSTEGFKQCVCSRATEQNCQDTDVVGNLYRTGQLTENSKLVRYEPSGTDYPAVRGCSQMKPNWDFTDFGN